MVHAKDVIDPLLVFAFQQLATDQHKTSEVKHQNVVPSALIHWASGMEVYSLKNKKKKIN